MQSQEIIASIIGAIIQVVGGAVGGFLIAYFTLIRQQRRKRIEYEYSAASLLETKHVSKSPLTVSVDKSIVTGDEHDKGSSIIVNTAYAFVIKLVNRGNETITNPTVEVRLDNQAIIVSYEYEPDYWPGQQPVRDMSMAKPNILRLSFPFINKKQTITITATSIQNESSECSVSVLGPEIEAFSRRNDDADAKTSSINPFVQGLAIILLGMLILLLSFVMGGFLATLMDAWSKRSFP